MANSKAPKRVTGPWGGVPGSTAAEYTVIDTEQWNGDILCLQNILKTKITSERNDFSDEKKAKQCFSIHFKLFYIVSFFIIHMCVGQELDKLGLGIEDD